MKIRRVKNAKKEKAKIKPKVVKLYIKGNNHHTFYILSYKNLNLILFIVNKQLIHNEGIEAKRKEIA